MLGPYGLVFSCLALVMLFTIHLVRRNTLLMTATAFQISGAFCNLAAVAANGWLMPVSKHLYTPDPYHKLLIPSSTHLLFLCDIFAPLGFSIGDVLLTVGVVIIIAMIIRRTQ